MRSSDARRMGKCWVTAALSPEVRRKINGQEYETATRESGAFDPQACRYEGWYRRGLESGRRQEVPREVRLRNDDPRRTIISPCKEPRSSRSEGGVTRGRRSRVHRLDERTVTLVDDAPLHLERRGERAVLDRPRLAHEAEAPLGNSCAPATSSDPTDQQSAGPTTIDANRRTKL